MNNKIIVVGASGHAKSIAVVLEMLNFEIVGFIDSFLPMNSKVLKYKTLGDELILKDCFRNFGTNNVVLGIGNIWDRKFFLSKLKEVNKQLNYPSIVSPMSYLDQYSSIGQGTVVLNNALINTECKVGEFCIINSLSCVEHNTQIGDFCNISQGAMIGGNVQISNNTFIGSSSTIIQKRIVGENCVLAAGAVLTTDIPNNVLAAGIPAVIKRENYYNKNILK